MCTADGCSRWARYTSYGLCATHYEYRRRRGLLPPLPTDTKRVFPLEPLHAAIKRWGDYIPAAVELHYSRSHKAKVNKRPRRGDMSAPHHIPRTWPDEVVAAAPTTLLAPVLIEVCGLTSGQLWTIRDRGGLNEAQADQCATALNMHPSAIWGDLWREATEAAIRAEEAAMFARIRREVA